ncbi:MAG: hypothetical protein FNP40_00370 [Dehalobacter sp. 4CP]|nr:hypothetical protein [Dehalobacter sp. 4CP]
MTGDLMDRVFNDIKAKKSESLTDKALSKQTLSDETLSLKELDIKLLNEAIEAANNKRRMIGVWSPTIAAAMWYLKGTIPRFSISEVASHWIEEGLERDYPELMQRIRERMKK